MALMKKVMFGVLFFFIAFELISCIPLLDDRQPELSPYFNCIGEKQSSCMPKGNEGLSPQALFDKKRKCISDSHTACQPIYDKILSEFQNTEPIDEFNCIGQQCLPQPTLPTGEPKPEEKVNNVQNVTEVIINGDHMNITNEVPERTLMVDSKELKRAAEGKCLTKGHVCRIPFKAINNSSYLIEDCCEGQFCDQILKNNVEFGQCCLQNDRNNCWLP
ncbi:uncharacterized protein LOC130810158 [Amaranthus tricolor]|uniref:uncharacterized protein LOC130810158 n=1 Tax=Amaranthus tricolor TaxID=29722 RepID=UPI00258FC03D|nr:uncharacterized protein LOC130810158 [Amaranthus tricolor]